MNTNVIKTVAVMAALIALGAALYFSFKTDYKILYSGMSVNEIVPLQSAIEEEGIKTRIGEQGTVLEVDSERFQDAKVIASAGFTDDDSFTFADALSSAGIDDASDRIFVKAFEEKLAEELARFDGVTSAGITLGVPEASRLFIHDDESPRASAMVTVSRELTPGEGENMARYLMASIEGLEMENITIIDQEYRVVYDGGKPAEA